VSKEVRRNEIYKEYEWVIHETMHRTSINDGFKDLILRDIEKILTKLEYLVYTLREVQNFSVEYIAKTYGLDEKVVYNSLHRAKSKIKMHFAQR
jgi:RNA polymerase sporulation-specific sigma factor